MAPFGRSVTPPSVIPSCAACSVADGAPTPGAAEPLAPFGCMGALHPMRQTAPCIKPQGGLSPPVQQSRKLPSDAVRVPPSVASLCLFSVGRGSPSGAADPWLPSVAVWRLRLSFRVALRARWRTGLPLPVQQSRWLPSVVMGALLPTRQTAPCTKPQGGLSPPVQQSRSSLRTQWESLHQSHLFAIQRRTGLPFRCSRPTAPFGRSVTPPSVISSCAACSVADGAPTPGAAEPLAPFGCNGSPSSDASNRALH